ncbi:MAG: glycosyltransferase, partial [Cyclobacteriaceae bacterium]
FITTWLIGQKLYYFWVLNSYDKLRPITEKPLFFLALIAVVIGTQLFLAGFLAEMIQSRKGHDDYKIIDKKGFDS